MELLFEIRTIQVEKDELAIIWLGQAGFILKDSGGRTVTIDPYLSDYCERSVGFKRLSPKLIEPGQLKTDIVFSSHEHQDHLDVDSVPLIMSDKNTKLIGPGPSLEICRGMGISEEQLLIIKEGTVVDFDWIRFTGVYADHGDLAPDAIGVFIEIDGISIYYAGDTAYCPEKIRETIKTRPDIMIAPINGEYGNLDHTEALRLAVDLGAGLLIPCHYWMFAEHGGNPLLFMEGARKLGIEKNTLLLCPGEVFRYSKK